MTARGHKRLAPGVRRRTNGTIEGYVQVGSATRSRTFLPGTRIRDVQSWRIRERAALRDEQGIGRDGTTLAQALDRYAHARRGAPSVRSQVGNGKAWLTALGPLRTLQSIDAATIDETIRDWLAQGRKPSTVKLRITSLKGMLRTCGYTDGDAERPLPAFPRVRSNPLEARGLRYNQIMPLLAAIKHPQMRARCTVMAWTGLHQAQLRRLRPDDILWADNALRIAPRVKGKGSGGRIVPLLPEAIEALRRFDELDCYGDFWNSAMRRSFQQAAKEVGLTGVRPYDLRHSFGTLIYQATSDLATTAHLMSHHQLTTTMRYTLAAIPRVAEKAIRTAHREVRNQLRGEHERAPEEQFQESDILDGSHKSRSDS